MPQLGSDDYCNSCKKSYASGFCTTHQIICFSYGHPSDPWVHDNNESCMRCEAVLKAKAKAGKEKEKKKKQAEKDKKNKMK